jgi:oligopeptide transport system ATP-binding protein
VKVSNLKKENREEILRVEDLRQYFKVGSGRNKTIIKAVDDISFSINKGEVFSLVGESGCGKTTTGRAIIKLYEATGGEVYFNGVRIIADYKKAKKVHAELMKAFKEAKKGNLSESELEQWQTKINTSLENLRSTRRNRHFERIVSEEGKETLKNIENVDEYKLLVEKYQGLAENIKTIIEESKKEVEYARNELEKINKSDKVLFKEKQRQLRAFEKKLRNAEKELKLNQLRFKMDVKSLKHDIKYKNKLLMRKMQMIFQDPIASLNPRMTVKEIVAEGLRINGVKNERVIEERVNEALKMVKLVPEHASRYPHEFSGGQRQRIGIARALVVNPSFIIADEPISNLDVSIRAQIINLLNDLRQEKGITILFIAHDLSVVKYFTDRLAVMYFGKIVEMGDKEKIFNNPLHPYTKSLLDSIPQPDPYYERKRGKTRRYNPSLEHDYSKELPTLREVEEGHFVFCNQEEFEKYKASLK